MVFHRNCIYHCAGRGYCPHFYENCGSGPGREPYRYQYPYSDRAHLLHYYSDYYHLLNTRHLASCDSPACGSSRYAYRSHCLCHPGYLKDLVAGFYILLERPFHIGDQITIGDENKPPTHTGVVEDVQIRATKLRIVSGEQVTVPNSLIFGGIVINNSYYGERRATISLTLPQEGFVKDETRDQIIKALKEIEAVIPKPEPAVMITGYTGNSITLTVRYWVANRQQAAISQVIYSLRKVLPNADLTILEPAGNI